MDFSSQRREELREKEQQAVQRGSGETSPAVKELLGQMDPLQAEAMQWFVRLQGEPEDQGLHAKFNAWIRSDVRHQEAFAEVERLWDVSLEAPATRQAYQRYTRRQFLRKAAITGGVGLAVTSSLIYLADRFPFAQYRTGTGERRSIDLPDGSSVELSTRTALSAAFNGQERRIHLHEGEAYFSVERDSLARPFVVESRAGEATALGTEFSVATMKDAARLSVTEHTVRVTSGHSQSEVTAGQTVQYGNGRQGKIMPLLPSVLAWRSGRLEFIATPLGEAVHALDQWRTGKTVLADGKLALLPLTMLIDLSRISEGIQGLPSILPVRTVEITPLLTVIYSA